MPQREGASLLTSTQREWLRGEEKPVHENQVRSGAYSRIRRFIREDAEVFADALENGLLDPQVIMRDIPADDLRRAISAVTAALYILGERGKKVDVERSVQHGITRGRSGELAELRERLDDDPGSLTLSELIRLRMDQETQRDTELADKLHQYFELEQGKPNIGFVDPDAEIDLEELLD